MGLSAFTGIRNRSVQFLCSNPQCRLFETAMFTYLAELLLLDFSLIVNEFVDFLGPNEGMVAYQLLGTWFLS